MIEKNTIWIKDKCHALGFDYCGIAHAEKLDEDARRLEAWLSKGMHGKMQYMENYFDLRTDPTRLVPGAKSVITLLINYFPHQQQNV
ncbi:MAG: epoxyqueuosine reductase, partial [Segetibacter sp.]|nr:epoxyqueuosine reductase [Segetibacter sp.]